MMNFGLGCKVTSLICERFGVKQRNEQVQVDVLGKVGFLVEKEKGRASFWTGGFHIAGSS